MARLDKWIWIILLAYAIGFLSFPARVLLINDEERYVVQALAFSRGALTVPGALAENQAPPARTVTDYPPGTSALQAPFVLVGGWRAAALLSVLSLVMLTLATRALLREFRLPAEFALLILAYPGNLLFGRMAMSDVPGAAIATCAILMLSSARSRDSWWAFGAGLVAASTLLFREPLALIVLPFVLPLFRRGWRRWVPMVLGATAGVSIRLVAALALFGSAFHVRDAGFGFSLASIAENLPLYTFLLLVSFPLGMLLPLAYRGMSRWQVTTAFAAYLILILSFEYNPWRDNGIVRGTALASRFITPITPLLVVMAADVWPRWLTRANHWRPRRWMLTTSLAILTVGAIGIHSLTRVVDAKHLGLVRTIASHAPPVATLVVNERSVGKYVSPAYVPRRLISSSSASATDLMRQCRAGIPIRLVLLDRFDTEVFRTDSGANAVLLERLGSLPLRMLHDSSHAPHLRLRIYDVAGCGTSR